MHGLGTKICFLWKTNQTENNGLMHVHLINRDTIKSAFLFLRALEIDLPYNGVMDEHLTLG